MKEYVNPFDILSASPRDSRQKLAALADTAALLQSPEAAQEARMALLRPQSRLEAEIRWCSPEKDEMRAALDALNGAVRKLPFEKASVQDLLALCRLYAAAGAESVCELINSDRQAAGFHEAALEDVRGALFGYARQIAQLLMEPFQNRTPKQLSEAFDQLCQKSAKESALFGCHLLEELVNAYLLRVADEEMRLRQRLEQFIRVTEETENNPWNKKEFKAICDDIHEWNRLIHPERVLYASRGMRHDASRHMVDRLDDAYIALRNRHHDLVSASALATALWKAFGDIPEWKKRLKTEKKKMDEWRAAMRATHGKVKNHKEEKPLVTLAKLLVFLLAVCLLRSCTVADVSPKPAASSKQAVSAEAVQHSMQQLELATKARAGSLKTKLNELDARLLKMSYAKGTETYAELEAERAAVQEEYEKQLEWLEDLEEGRLPWMTP